MSVEKVTVVTVCLNARDTIRLTLESVARQSFGNIEHVIIDGGSTDGTQDIVREYDVGHFVSERDGGVYDAMDKGARAATGDIVIFLNAGDVFFDNGTCESVARFFDDAGPDIVFGNLMPVYLKPSDTHDHGAFTAGQLLDLGYLHNRRQLLDESIHHQATFYRRWVLEKCTYFCEQAPEASGEYNLLMNAVFRQNARVRHIPIPVARFVLGGISTRDFKFEWDKFVRAREILLSIYCPDRSLVSVKSEHEFCPPEQAVHNISPPIKARLKQAMKRSLVFRFYDRLMISLTSRIFNSLVPRIDGMLELQVQRVFNDLSSVNERTAKRLESQSHRVIDRAASRLESRFVSLERANAQILQGLQGIMLQASGANIGIAGVALAVNRSDDFSAHGYKVYSQWDEDGLIQYLVSRCPGMSRSFVEIGVGDYSEANTRLLLEKEHWRGMIIDGNPDNIGRVRSGELCWRYGLKALDAFVDGENINRLLSENGFAGQIGILSIDVDGVDYWLWKAVEAVSPQLVICEYNGIFGSGARVTVPYDPKFDRTKKHYSWLYAGASLAALDRLGTEKGYTFIGTNSGGNNAFFIRNDVLAQSSVRVGRPRYKKPVFRESRTPGGALSYLDIEEGLKLISDMDVYDLDRAGLVKVRDIPVSFDADYPFPGTIPSFLPA